MSRGHQAMTSQNATSSYPEKLTRCHVAHKNRQPHPIASTSRLHHSFAKNDIGHLHQLPLLYKKKSSYSRGIYAQ